MNMKLIALFVASVTASHLPTYPGWESFPSAGYCSSDLDQAPLPPAPPPLWPCSSIDRFNQVFPASFRSTCEACGAVWSGDEDLYGGFYGTCKYPPPLRPPAPAICGDISSYCSLQRCIDSCTDEYPSTTNVEYHCNDYDYCECFCQSGCTCMESVGGSTTWAPVGTLVLPTGCDDNGNPVVCTSDEGQQCRAECTQCAPCALDPTFLCPSSCLEECAYCAPYATCFDNDGVFDNDGFEGGIEFRICDSDDCSSDCGTQQTVPTGECVAESSIWGAIFLGMGGVGDVPEQSSVIFTCDGDTVIATSYTTSNCSDDGTTLPTNTFPKCLSALDILEGLVGAFEGLGRRRRRLDDIDNLMLDDRFLNLGLASYMSLEAGFLCKTPAATVVTSFTLAGAVEDFGEKERAAIKAVLAAGAGVSLSAISLTLSSGSVVVTAKILFKVSAAADAAVIALSGANGILSDATKLQEALVEQFAEDGIDTDVTVSRLEPPEVESDDDDGGGCGAGCIVGIVVGVLALIALSVLLFLWLTGAACFKKADGGHPTGKPGVAGAGEAA